MSAVARGADAVTVVRGQPDALAMTLQNPDGSGMDLTGLTVTAALLAGDGTDVLPVVPGVKAGVFSVPLAADLTANLPVGGDNPRVAITVAGGQDGTAYFVVPLAPVDL